ncbi:MAG: hypothetical protein FK730_11510 [Asgard group archaeon]|nr:hypothetical protein [Asgard group archaeon]
MTKLVISRKRTLSNIFLIVIIFVAQLLGTSLQQISSKSSLIDNFSENEIIDQIKSSTSELTSLFNNELGIFIWNIQNPLNISRYGDLSDASNVDDALDQQFTTKEWLNGLTQDIMMQYLFLKKYVYPTLSYTSETEEDIQFTRDWLFTTEKIVGWLYYLVATNNELIKILSSFSESGDGFGEYWNALIRPKYHEFIGETLALLPDTLALGSKILQIAEFLPHFSFIEKYPILLLSDIVSQWWNNINIYALFDPKFAVGGIGNSYLHYNHDEWIGWNEFTRMSRNSSFSPKNVYDEDYVEFLNYLYISPQIADEYLTYICKYSCGSTISWNPKAHLSYTITEPTLIVTQNRLVNDYAKHISWVENQIQYIYDPRNSEFTWIPLDNPYSGYSYYWPEYLIDNQGSENDLRHYQYNLPLAIINMRTFQGAGDICGLLDIYQVLSHNFVCDSTIQYCEDKAIKILDQILKSAREDNGFVFSPYFGTALDESILVDTLISDAELIGSLILPDGLNQLTGTLTIMDFLLKSRDDLLAIGHYSNRDLNKEFNAIKKGLDNALESIGNLIIDNIDSKTCGISKQTVIANSLLLGSNIPPYYSAKPIKITIQIESTSFPLSELPEWIHSYNYYSSIGQSNIYQWDYLNSLSDLYAITRNTYYIAPLFDAVELFDQDLREDDQYQLSAICEGKDPVVRAFFDESYIGTNIELNDNTGIFGNYIPYDYRQEVLPLANAFASETPLRIFELILKAIPIFNAPLFSEIIVNKVVLVGFITGLMMTIAVVYVKRPKHQ